VITYWVNQRDRYTIDAYLATRGEPIAGRFQVRPYESVDSGVTLAGGALIFSAIDQLGPRGRAVVRELWDAAGRAAPGWRRLNDPGRLLLRAPLLEALARAGLNDFQAWPALGPWEGARYPVFIREADRHSGPLTGLLDSPAATRRALSALRVRGYRPAELLVVEYLHTADERQRFRKYSAYRVGAAIVRTHLMIGHSWSVKSDTDAADVEAAREAAEYLAGTLHEEWLRQVFDLAGTDFGRIDYGVAQGRPQAWEINLNPTMSRRPGQPRKVVAPEVQAIRDESRAGAHARLRAAFLALDSAAGPETVRVTLDPALLRGAAVESRAAARREAATEALRRLFHSSAIGRPVRALYDRLFPRG